MRVLAIFTGLLAILAGTYGGYAVMRAVGPEDRTNDFGYGDGAVAPPGGGTLLQSKNFARVLTALKREIGSEGGIDYMSVEVSSVRATTRRDGRQLNIEVDASGRSQTNESDDDGDPVALVPLSKIKAAALDKMVAAAREETGVPVESMTLYGGRREWTVNMLRGEPDSFIANLDGGGLRLSGEPNPDPIGASQDSMLRSENLQKVLDQVAKEGSELIDLSIWPERVSADVVSGSRQVRLDYSYGAQLTSRTVSARTGAPQKTVKLSSIDPEAIERMAKHPRAKGLKNVQYVLLQPADVFSPKPMLSMYLPQGNEPPYIIADLHGRHITWPGRG